MSSETKKQILKFCKNSFVIAALGLVFFSTNGCHGERQESSTLKSLGNRTGQLRGFIAINQAIRDRMLADDPTSQFFSVGSYIGQGGTNLEGVSVILGGFTGIGPANRFRNGQPNAMNLLLWDRALTGFAKSLSFVCVTNSFSGVNVKPEFSAQLVRLCTWPSDDAKAVMNNVWDTAMGLNDFDTEKDEWKEFFQSDSSPYKDATSFETVEAMLRAVFLHPFFLLEV